LNDVRLVVKPPGGDSTEQLGRAMKPVALAAVTATFLAGPPAWAQGPDPWRMHEWMGWGWGGMWFGPLFMIALLALLVAGVVALVRWSGSRGSDGGGRVRTARDILDERYARGEIDREEYQRRRDDIAGRS
jgi:putative membrane protein